VQGLGRVSFLVHPSQDGGGGQRGGVVGGAWYGADDYTRHARGAWYGADDSTATLAALLVLAATNVPRGENKRGPSGAER
jgi:hypothetical protein